MSILRIIPLAAAIVLPALAAAGAGARRAETPQLMTAVEPEPSMPPVMDSGVTAHVLLDQLEGRFNGSNPEFRWDGQGWAGTDLDKLWIKSEGTFSNGRSTTASSNSSTTARSRPISIFRAGFAATSIPRPARNWGAFGIQGLAPYFFDLEVDRLCQRSAGHFAGRSRLPTTS